MMYNPMKTGNRNTKNFHLSSFMAYSRLAARWNRSDRRLHPGRSGSHLGAGLFFRLGVRFRGRGRLGSFLGTEVAEDALLGDLHLHVVLDLDDHLIIRLADRDNVGVDAADGQ